MKQTLCDLCSQQIDKQDLDKGDYDHVKVRIEASGPHGPERGRGIPTFEICLNCAHTLRIYGLDHSVTNKQQFEMVREMLKNALSINRQKGM